MSKILETVSIAVITATFVLQGLKEPLGLTIVDVTTPTVIGIVFIVLVALGQLFWERLTKKAGK